MNKTQSLDAKDKLFSSFSQYILGLEKRNNVLFLDFDKYAAEDLKAAVLGHVHNNVPLDVKPKREIEQQDLLEQNTKRLDEFKMNHMNELYQTEVQHKKLLEKVKNECKIEVKNIHKNLHLQYTKREEDLLQQYTKSLDEFNMNHDHELNQVKKERDTAMDDLVLKQKNATKKMKIQIRALVEANDNLIEKISNTEDKLSNKLLQIESMSKELTAVSKQATEMKNNFGMVLAEMIATTDSIKSTMLPKRIFCFAKQSSRTKKVIDFVESLETFVSRKLSSVYGSNSDDTLFC